MVGEVGRIERTGTLSDGDDQVRGHSQAHQRGTARVQANPISDSPFGFRSISVSGRRGVGHRTIRSRLNATCLYRQALQHGVELGIDLVSPLAKRALSLLTEDVGYNRP